jgi:hypothetical protein
MRALAIACLLSGVARADDSMRCPGGLVAVGVSARVVLEKCGSPTQQSRHYERRRTRYGWRELVIDTWSYDRGSYEFVRILTLSDGVLTAIEVGDYGTRITSASGSRAGTARHRR